MESKLQKLTDKIYKEGVVKAEEEAEKIIEKSKQEASDIIKNSQKEAAQIIEQAEKRSKEIRQNVLSDIKLSAQQAISSIRQKIANLITARLIEEPVEKALDDVEFIQKIITIAIKNWDPHDTEKIDLSLLLPKKHEKEFEDYFLNKGRSLINAGVEVHFHEGVSGGFRIGPQDGSYIISFSDEDFKTFLEDYLKPKTIHTLYGEK
tara:strand:+ start:1350 stop:1967 length:618 start_codon:yes stop_codon:yes gene_type:complete